MLRNSLHKGWQTLLRGDIREKIELTPAGLGLTDAQLPSLEDKEKDQAEAEGGGEGTEVKTEQTEPQRKPTEPQPQPTEPTEPTGCETDSKAAAVVTPMQVEKQRPDDDEVIDSAEDFGVEKEDGCEILGSDECLEQELGKLIDEVINNDKDEHEPNETGGDSRQKQDAATTATMERVDGDASDGKGNGDGDSKVVAGGPADVAMGTGNGNEDGNGEAGKSPPKPVAATVVAPGDGNEDGNGEAGKSPPEPVAVVAPGDGKAAGKTPGSVDGPALLPGTEAATAASPPATPADAALGSGNGDSDAQKNQNQKDREWQWRSRNQRNSLEAAKAKSASTPASRKKEQHACLDSLYC